MRPTVLFLLTLAVAALGAGSAWLLQPRSADAAEISTLYMSGFEIGRGRTAVVRLHNSSPSLADTFTVRYTVRDPRAGAPITPPGAGDGARLTAGQTLELDLGAIVDAHRAGLGAGPYAGPVQFVAFGTGGQFRTFGPETVIAEGLQRNKRAKYAIAVEWVTE